MTNLVALIETFQRNHDPAYLRSVIRERDKTIRNQQTVIARQAIKIAQQGAIIRRLERRLKDAELRLLRQAEQDVIAIGALHFAGLYTSRRACSDLGIGCNRWMRATALLKVGRAHDGRSITVETPEDYERALRVASERVRRDGMETLQCRLPKCLR